MFSYVFFVCVSTFVFFSIFFFFLHAWFWQGSWQGGVGKGRVGKERLARWELARRGLARRGWQGGVGKERLARGGGGLALEGKELRLGDNSSKGPFAIQFANPKIVDKQRVFRYPKKINQHTERKNIDKHRSKRQVGMMAKRLAKVLETN